MPTLRQILDGLTAKGNDSENWLELVRDLSEPITKAGFQINKKFIKRRRLRFLAFPPKEAVRNVGHNPLGELSANGCTLIMSVSISKDCPCGMPQ
jgi:hypothetical protein